VTNRTVAVALKAEVSGYLANLRTAKAATGEFVGGLDTMARKSPGQFSDVLRATAGVGVALLALPAAAVKVGMAFDQQLSAVQAVTNATGKEMESLRTAALESGRATVFSATQSAQAEAALGRAGLSTSEIVGGALAGSLALAAAGTVDLAEAADVAAKTMRIFNLAGADVGHIADVLAAAANKSATDVSELGMALRQGGQVAAMTGLTLEDTVGTLAAFADNALIGSDAGTSLKTMLQKLANPAAETADLMRQLGINAYDASGNFIGITKLAGQLQTKLGTLTQAQRDQALAQIFGADATRAANVLYKLGADGLRRYVEAVDDSGAAADAAAKKTDNLAGDLEKLRGSLENVAIESGGSASTGLRKLTQITTALVDNLGDMPPAVSGTLTVMAGLAGGALLLGAGLLKVRQVVHNAVDALNDMGPAGKRAATGLETTAKWAGRATLALTALQVAGAVVSSFQKDLNPQIDALAKSLEEFAKQGRIAGEMARLFGKSTAGLPTNKIDDLDRALAAVASKGFAKFADGATDFALGLVGINSPLDEGKEKIQALDQALAQLVQGGDADAAAKAMVLLEERAKAQGLSLTRLHEAFPAYFAALQTTGTAADQSADAIKRNAEANQILTGTLDDAIAKLGSFGAAFDALHGKALSMLDADIAAEQAIDNLTEAIEKNGKTTDINTQKGRDNLRAVEAGIKGAEAAAQKTYEQTGSVAAASKTYDGYITRLRNAMLAAGMNRAEVDKLLGLYARMPALVATNVTAPGLATVLDSARRLQTITNDLDGRHIRTYYSAVTLGRTASPYAQRWGGAVEHAQSGLLRDASVYSAGSSPLYAFAEPATRGEAFIPKSGDYGRSMSVLSHAAGWYGAQVVPAGSGGGRQVVEVVLTGGDASTAALLKVLRKDIRTAAGGNVQRRLGRNAR
jgi:TP901 family phage tail tape measure protein